MEAGQYKVRYRRKMWIGIFILAVILVITFLCLKIDNWKRDWTQNAAETNVAATEEWLRPLEIECDLADLADRFQHMPKDMPHWKLEKIQRDSRAWLVHLVRQTYWLRFSDDITVTLTPRSDNRVYVEAKSKSRIGKGDLGQNPRNIKELMQWIRSQAFARG